MDYEKMNYAEIKELDMKSEKLLTDHPGPADECICNILAPPIPEKKGVRESLKRAIRSVSGVKKRAGGGGGGGAAVVSGAGGGYKAADGGGGGGGNHHVMGANDGGGGLIVPLSDTPGAGGFVTRKETVKRGKPCGRGCGCKDSMTMKHTEAVIKITAPDISNVCPCPGTCLPGADKLNNVSVVVEHMTLSMGPGVLDISDSEGSVICDAPTPPEPVMQRKSITELIEAQYNDTQVQYSTIEDKREKTDALNERNDKDRQECDETKQSYMEGKREEKAPLPKVVNGDDDDDSDWSFGSDGNT